MLHLVIVLPIILFSLKDWKIETLKVLLIFSFFYMLNGLLLCLPLEVPSLDIFGGSVNWTGKLFAITGILLFLIFYRKYNLKEYFLTIKQNKTFLKKGIAILLIILTGQIIIAFLFEPKRTLDFNYLNYEFFLPGIHEEIAYRGIMLGLLTKILNEKIKFLNPSILVTALLFGFAHGLFVKNFGIEFDFNYFFMTFSFGIVWGWITLRTGSVLLAIISHNFGNGFRTLIRMI